MLGESVVKLAQAIGHVIEAVRLGAESHASLLGAVVAEVSGTPLWLEIAGIVFTAAMVFVMYFTLQHSIKLSREQEFVRQKDRLLEDMSSIMEAASTLMTDFDDPNDMTGRNICTKLVNIHKIISVKLIFISNLPITSQYLREYPVSLVGKVYKREREDTLLDERKSSMIMAFIDNTENIFLEIAKLPQESFSHRINCENISYISYGECCLQDIEDKSKLLERAMVNLRKSPPESYDFSKDVEASPSQPKN